MDREEIERLVRLERIYTKVKSASMINYVVKQLERERARREKAGLEDLVTQIRSEP